jgi:CubicO group peptidase (beta-lactamase class C family)
VAQPGIERRGRRCAKSTSERLGLIVLLGVIAVAAQACGRDTPAVTLRGDRFDPVRSLIEETIRKQGVASVAIAAAQDGEIVWEEAFGWADKENRVPATPNSIYALASISKSFTATGLMVLVESGLVDLDRPVNDYLAEAKLVSHVGDPAEATVRRVLQHTAGLPSHHNIFFDGELVRPPEQDESIRRYGMVVDEPGREFVYSNFGYGVLDRVISSVSGMSYAQFMRAEVFEPLGLTHTSVHVDPALRHYAVRHYDGGSVVPSLDFDHVGASAVHSSVHDLIRYGMFHLGNELPDQQQILSGPTIDMMHEPSDVIMPEEILEVRLGLGWAIVDLDGVRMVNVTGGMPGTVTRLALIPAQNAAVAIMINSGIGDAYAPWEIELATFAAMIPDLPKGPEIVPEREPSAPLPAAMRGEWRGSVSTHLGDLPARLSVGEGRDMELEIDGRKTVPVRVRSPLGDARFKDGVFEAPFFGTIETDDALRSRHVLFLRLRKRDDVLSGVVAAVAMNQTFWLPYWVELKRVPEDADRR